MKDILIKAEEFRVGNLCMDKLTGEWLSVDEIKRNEKDEHIVIFYVINRDKYPLPAGWQVAPIPLTPEILEKAGFSDGGFSVDANWYYKLINLPSNWMSVTYELNLFTTEEENKYGVNLETQYFGYFKYLHQLQNLYFALTGEELPIEL